MNRNAFNESVRSAAATFRDEFPTETEVSLSWLADAAAAEGVADEDRDLWFECVIARLAGVRDGSAALAQKDAAIKTLTGALYYAEGYLNMGTIAARDAVTAKIAALRLAGVLK